jgi:GntR family transcriptional regulator, transcriptional repressor for pyruvate dehydrogenase complex
MANRYISSLLTFNDPPFTIDLMKRRPISVGSDYVQDNKDNVTNLLILRFQQMLSDGVLTPGTKLPPERELAAHFKVARSSLRQALKVLEIMGVITQKIGDGSYLNRDASSVLRVPMEFLFLLDDTTIEELAELRFIIEPALAAKAAERATSADIDLLHQSIADLESSEGDRVKMVASDLLFHRTIFQASGNRLTGRLFHTIHRAMLDMITVTSQLVDLAHTVEFHKPILKAIERRNPELAARLMRAHIEDATKLSNHGREIARARALRDHLAITSAGFRKAKQSAGLIPLTRRKKA